LSGLMNTRPMKIVRDVTPRLIKMLGNRPTPLQQVRTSQVNGLLQLVQGRRVSRNHA